MSNFSCRWVAIAAAALLVGSAAHAVPPITPVKVTLHWSASAPKPAPVEIRLRGGTTAYHLWLEPEKDADGRIYDLDLVLRPNAHGGKVIQNLLEPPGNWHGYQIFMFGAWDFAKGADKSIYGATRDFGNALTPLRVKATVINVSVVRTPAKSVSDYEMASLDLRVEIDNPTK